MAFLKTAFDLGTCLAYEEAGLTKASDDQISNLIQRIKDINWPWKEEPGAFSTWKPYAVGAGLGLGAYGLLRYPMLADPKKYPALRRIQEASGGKMFRMGRRTKKQNLVDKVVDPLLHGPEVHSKKELSKVVGTPDKPTAVFSGYEAKPRTGTFDPSIGPVPPAEAEQIFTAQQAFEDKLLQAQLLEKYAPGSMAKTHKIEEIMAKNNLQLRPDHLEEDLPKLQAALRQEYGERPYIIKTRAERPGGDPMTSTTLESFPTRDTDLYREYQDWGKMRDEFLSQVGNAPAETVKKYRNMPGFRGRLVDEILHQNAIVQEMLPIRKYTGSTAKSMEARGFAPVEEYRVHAIGGHVNPRLVVPRRYSDIQHFVPEYTTRSREVADYAQNVLNKLPPEYRNMSFGMDVAPLEGQPGQWRIIELNPGGQSGILDQPTMGHALHREITGRSTVPESVAGGLLAGGVGTGISGAAMNIYQNRKKGRNHA